MESAVKPFPANRFRTLSGLAQSCTAGAVMVVASALASSALANTITFETAPLGVFTAPVTENGFTYSRLSGELFVGQFGNPGQDLEGLSTVGGGALKIVSATGGDFNFNALDFAAFNILGTGSQTLKAEGLFGGTSVGVDQYTLANTKVFNPKYDNWTTEAASVLAGKSISELDITLNASIAGSGSLSSENIDNVVLTAGAGGYTRTFKLDIARGGGGRSEHHSAATAPPFGRVTSIDLPRQATFWDGSRSLFQRAPGGVAR
jgi:hypothetical protein